MHPEKVQYLGDNEWQNVYLQQMEEDGVLKLIDRQNDSRGRSGCAAIFAGIQTSYGRRGTIPQWQQTINTKDIVPRAPTETKKAFRDWLKRVRKGYEFDVAKLDAATHGEIVNGPNWRVEWKYCLAVRDGFDEFGLKMSTRLVVVHGPRRRPRTERKFFSKKKKKRRERRRRRV